MRPYCPQAARATLNLMQFRHMAELDQASHRLHLPGAAGMAARAKATWSSKRLERAERRAALHAQDCLTCFLSSIPSSQGRVPQ